MCRCLSMCRCCYQRLCVRGATVRSTVLVSMPTATGGTGFWLTLAGLAHGRAPPLAVKPPAACGGSRQASRLLSHIFGTTLLRRPSRPTQPLIPLTVLRCCAGRRRNRQAPGQVSRAAAALPAVCALGVHKSTCQVSCCCDPSNSNGHYSHMAHVPPRSESAVPSRSGALLAVTGPWPLGG